MDVANVWDNFGAYADPQFIQGMSWKQIAAALGQSIEGGAVQLIAEICQATGGQPATLCGSSVVQQWEAELLTYTFPP